MDDISVQVDEPTRIVTMARDSAGAGVTGATLSLKIYRNVDGYYFNGTGFQSSATSLTMTETSSANMPGVYHYDFLPHTAFRGIIYITTATAGVVNDPFVATLLVGSWLDNVDFQSSGLASDSDMQVVLSRLGSVFVDNEFANIRTVLREIVKRLP